MKTTFTRPGRHWLAEAVAWFLVTFFVLFPKGGIKLGILPLTWGYLAIALSLPGLLVVRLLCMRLSFRKANLAVAGTIVPFAALFLYSVKANGIEVAAFAVSDFVAVIAMPLLFILLYADFLHLVDGQWLERGLRRAMFYAAVFGIFLFILHPITGHLIEIPYLTVNADDYGTLEKTKDIDRGFFLKLISTYNNGNVYGVATLILLPLFDVFEPKRWKRGLMKFALVLTLSRTVWGGLILLELLSFANIALGAIRSFPRLALGPALKTGLIVMGTMVAVLLGLALTAQNLAYLFDSNLGGRTGSIVKALTNPTLLPSQPVTAFTEIVYASALSEYGILGCLSVILIFVFPIVLGLLNPAWLESPTRRAALKGMILYMFLAAIDGAINLIPVMTFYWFAYMIFLEGWPPSRAPHRLPGSRTASPRRLPPSPLHPPIAAAGPLALALDPTSIRGTR
jgi:hypothetical protein